MAIDLKEAGLTTASLSGMKGSVLAELLLSKIEGVPEKGFMTTNAAVDKHLEANNLKEKIEELNGQITDYQNEQQLEEITKEIRDLIRGGEVPEEVKKQILSDIKRHFGEEFPLALIVRSTVNLEDTPEEAAPGLYDSVVVVLNNLDDEEELEKLWNATKKVWSSKWHSRATALRHKLGVAYDAVSPGALFLELIDGVIGGVANTASADGNYNQFIIEATHGGPGNLVDSNQLPAQYSIRLLGGEIQTLRATSDIDKYTVFEKGKPVIKDVPPELKDRAVILDESLKRQLVERVLKIRKVLKRPAIDVEWIVDRQGKIHILQARFMVQDKAFPVNQWQDLYLDFYAKDKGSGHTPYSSWLKEEAGEEEILAFNRLRYGEVLDDEGEVIQLTPSEWVDRLIKDYITNPNANGFAKAIAAETLISGMEYYWKRDGITAILDVIEPYFREGGELYNLYGDASFFGWPQFFNALDIMTIILKDYGRLPPEIEARKMDVFTSLPFWGHWTAGPSIRIINELKDEILFDKDGKRRFDEEYISVELPEGEEIPAQIPEEGEDMPAGIPEEQARQLESLNELLEKAVERVSEETMLRTHERKKGPDHARLL